MRQTYGFSHYSLAWPTLKSKLTAFIPLVQHEIVP
jgi:hypothetical protein